MVADMLGCGALGPRGCGSTTFLDDNVWIEMEKDTD